MRTRRPRFSASLVLLCFFPLGASCGDPAAEDPDLPEPPVAQVVNNSGGRIDQVTVGTVTFSDNLSYNMSQYSTDNGTYCGDGCSTGFEDVAEGSSDVAVYQTAGSAAVPVGLLGAFAADTAYAVNIRSLGDGYCAEIWKRVETEQPFNEAARTRIATTCP